MNVTLLFSVQRYGEVADAYARALDARLARGLPVDHVASVASFFVSRVDSKIDPLLGEERAALRGRVAIANADLAYDAFQRRKRRERWMRVGARGARPQRLLWASTSPKDPAYDELHYVEALVAPETVDTMTRECLLAFADHGAPAARLGRDLEGSRRVLDVVRSLGLDFNGALAALEDEGVAQFAASYASALESIAKKRRRVA